MVRTDIGAFGGGTVYRATVFPRRHSDVQRDRRVRERRPQVRDVAAGLHAGLLQRDQVGTFCRTVVWPCIPPLLMYQYIRGVDEDACATEVLYFKSGSKDTKAFYDTSRSAAANPE